MDEQDIPPIPNRAYRSEGAVQIGRRGSDNAACHYQYGTTKGRHSDALPISGVPVRQRISAAGGAMVVGVGVLAASPRVFRVRLPRDTERAERRMLKNAPTARSAPVTVLDAVDQNQYGPVPGTSPASGRSPHIGCDRRSPVVRPGRGYRPTPGYRATTVTVVSSLTLTEYSAPGSKSEPSGTAVSRIGKSAVQTTSGSETSWWVTTTSN